MNLVSFIFYGDDFLIDMSWNIPKHIDLVVFFIHILVEQTILWTILIGAYRNFSPYTDLNLPFSIKITSFGR